MIHLVQLYDAELHASRVALVKGRALHVTHFYSMYELLWRAIRRGTPVRTLIRRNLMGAPHVLDYRAVHAGRDPWRLLPPIDHPEPARLHISGTGLTHLGSAKNRNAMHEKSASRAAAGNDKNQKSKIEIPETDSMKIFRWGLERGRPAEGQIGVAPEWFHKGDGHMLQAHGETLDVPSHALDGGEEAEIAGIYIIDPQGRPVRVGMAQGNEFSDHVFEKLNYLNLAGSKLRQCSLGPELVIDAAFKYVPGRVRVERAGRAIWSRSIATGEQEMAHSLANIEHHHFKFAQHCRPGDVHVHFFGTPALSYAEGIRLRDGDVMEVHYEGFGRPLRNPLRVEAGAPRLVTTLSLA